MTTPPSSSRLKSPAFCARLDPLPRGGAASNLLLAKVMNGLRDNPAPGAKKSIAALAQEPDFTKDGRRTDTLLAATSTYGPPTPGIVALWTKCLEPPTQHAMPCVAAITANGSPQGLAIFEKSMQDPRHTESLRQDWLRQYVLIHRNDEPLLDSSDRLLKSPLTASLKNDLLDVLFDYRPEDWYAPHTIAPPPRRGAPPRPARDKLRVIAAYAKASLAPTIARKAAIEKTLAELDALDQKDQKDKKGP